MKIRYLLFPIAWIYGAVAAFRRWLYRCGLLKSYVSPIKTIAVGNLSVGGTGKTPHVEYLIRLLSDKFEIATLSRGYKRKTKGFVLANDIDASDLSAETIGDEPLQFYTKFPSVKVSVAEQRKVGLQQLHSRFPQLQCVILDDCYQHLQVSPHCRVLITEYAQPYCQDFPVPVGRLREFKGAARFADVVIVSKCPSTLEAVQKKIWTQRLGLQSRQQLFFTTMVYSDLQPLTETARLQQISSATEIVVLTAIAHPEPLLEHLKNQYSLIRHYQYPDHHYFSKIEIENIYNQYFKENNKNRIIVTTEKDSMRLLFQEMGRFVRQLPLFSIAIEPRFLLGDKEKFDQFVISEMQKNYFSVSKK